MRFGIEAELGHFLDKSQPRERFQGLEWKRVNEVVLAVNVESLMPSDWKEQIDGVVERFGKFKKVPGGAVRTSHEPPSFITAYTVVTGDHIERELPWLWELYHGRFKSLVSEVAGQEVEVDPQPRYGANINAIDKATQVHGYEGHNDENDWTGMVAEHTMEEGDGGELLHELPNGSMVEARVESGWIYIFDGKHHKHKVKPLIHASKRTTVPLDYVLPGTILVRTPDFENLY